MASHEDASWTGGTPKQHHGVILASIKNLAIGHRLILSERYRIAAGQTTGTVAFRILFSQKCNKCSYQDLQYITTTRKAGLEITNDSDTQATRWTYTTECSCQNPFCDAKWECYTDAVAIWRMKDPYQSSLNFRTLYESLGDTVVHAPDGALLALTNLGAYDLARHQQRLVSLAPCPAPALLGAHARTYATQQVSPNQAGLSQYTPDTTIATTGFPVTSRLDQLEMDRRAYYGEDAPPISENN